MWLSRPGRPSVITPMTLQLAGTARLGPRLSKLQGFTIPPLVTPRLHWPAIGFTHTHTVPVRRTVWGAGEWSGMGWV